MTLISTVNATRVQTQIYQTQRFQQSSFQDPLIKRADSVEVSSQSQDITRDVRRAVRQFLSSDFFRSAPADTKALEQELAQAKRESRDLRRQELQLEREDISLRLETVKLEQEYRQAEEALYQQYQDIRTNIYDPIVNEINEAYSNGASGDVIDDLLAQLVSIEGDFKALREQRNALFEDYSSSLYDLRVRGERLSAEYVDIRDQKEALNDQIYALKNDINAAKDNYFDQERVESFLAGLPPEQADQVRALLAEVDQILQRSDGPENTRQLERYQRLDQRYINVYERKQNVKTEIDRRQERITSIIGRIESKETLSDQDFQRLERLHNIYYWLEVREESISDRFDDRLEGIRGRVDDLFVKDTASRIKLRNFSGESLLRLNEIAETLQSFSQSA